MLPDNTNPYHPPARMECASAQPRIGRLWRFGCLLLNLLPPAIPLLAHVISRAAVPPDDSPYHALLTLGALLPAWLLAGSLPGRFLLTTRKKYLAICMPSALIVAVVLLVLKVT